jgi:hypothetical protein
MNTSEVYSRIIIERIIKSYLERGEVPTLDQIEEEFEAIAVTQDLTSSDFTSEEWKVTRKEESSASKYNGMNDEIHQDLVVLYKSLLDSSDRSIQLFSRWQAKAQGLENRLRDLEARIGRLLALSQDTSGFFSIVGDKFTNTDLIDLDNSSLVAINLQQNIVTLDKDDSTNSIPDRIFLNDLRSSQVVFNTITRSNVISVSTVEGTEPRFAFRDQNQFWKVHITTSQKVSPFTTELTLSLDESITASRLDVYLHSSQNNSVTRVIPLVSTDSINYERLPVINEVAQGLDKVTFQFPQTEFKYLKIIFEKDSFDFTEAGLFVYEFGAKEIALFEEGFSTSGGSFGTLLSKPLSIVKPDQSLVQFNKLTLEVCEGISSETSLNYFIAVAQDTDGTPSWLTTSGFSADPTNRLWYPISPLNRTEPAHTKVLDFASLSQNERTGIGISYDRDAATLVSPAADFTLLSQTAGAVQYTDQTATDQRYIFSNSNQKLLDLQIDLDTPVDLSSLILWRNVGQKGIEESDTTQLVRGVQAGWEFEAPFYTTYIQIKGSNGLTLNVGNNPINIDSVNYTDVIGPDVLSPGIHFVKIHQDYWNPVTPNLGTLAELKAADILYPFNQKLLIEGYSYPEDWSSSELKVYQGVDRFAGIVPDKVSIFDFTSNVLASDLYKFAIDTDIPSTVDVGSYVILLNCDISKADFINEQCVLEFNLTNQLYSYAAFKAEFRTNSSQLTPVLDEYKIKLGF